MSLVLMGIFEASEANRNIKTLELKAYDFMLRFDKSFNGFETYRDALDLGDVIRFKGGQADENRISAITSMQCKIGGKHALKGVGKNPRLAHAKLKNGKNISGLLNQIIDNKEAGKIGIHAFTNASSFTVGESDSNYG